MTSDGTAGEALPELMSDFMETEAGEDDGSIEGSGTPEPPYIDDCGLSTRIPPSTRIVLIGKTGVGKSTAGNRYVKDIIYVPEFFK